MEKNKPYRFYIEKQWTEKGPKDEGRWRQREKERVWQEKQKEVKHLPRKFGYAIFWTIQCWITSFLFFFVTMKILLEKALKQGQPGNLQRLRHENNLIATCLCHQNPGIWRHLPCLGFWSISAFCWYPTQWRRNYTAGEMWYSLGSIILIFVICVLGPKVSQKPCKETQK